jgi:hypothetical protein
MPMPMPMPTLHCCITTNTELASARLAFLKSSNYVGFRHFVEILLKQRCGGGGGGGGGGNTNTT